MEGKWCIFGRIRDKLRFTIARSIFWLRSWLTSIYIYFVWDKQIINFFLYLPSIYKAMLLFIDSTIFLLQTAGFLQTWNWQITRKLATNGKWYKRTHFCEVFGWLKCRELKCQYNLIQMATIECVHTTLLLRESQATSYAGSPVTHDIWTRRRNPKGWWIGEKREEKLPWLRQDFTQTA